MSDVPTYQIYPPRHVLDQDAPVLTIGTLTLDMRELTVSNAARGIKLRIRRTGARLLAALMQEMNHPQSTEMLRLRAWRGRYTSPDGGTVRQQILIVRRVLHELGYDAEATIETRHGSGFQFNYPAQRMSIAARVAAAQHSGASA